MWNMCHWMTDSMEVRLRLATADDESEIMSLYEESKQIEGCTWDEHYPCKEIFDGDIKRGALFVLEDPKGNMIGCVSSDEDIAVQSLSCWNQEMIPRAEFARVAIKTEYQNRGLASVMIKKTIEELKLRGYKSACYLVSKHNKRALRAYAKLDFKRVGESDLFNQEWYCYEFIF